jgi:hypothetical protein
MAFDNFKKVVTEVMQLSSNGNITYPDASKQTTAFRGYAGQFSSYADQTTASSTALNIVSLPNTDYSDGVSVVSNKITYSNAGTYAFEFDAQVENADATARHDVYFFLRKNGNDVAGSTTSASVVLQNTGVNGKTYVGGTHIVTLSANDYLELVWAANDINVSLKYGAASATGIVRPSTASISVATYLIK